MFWHLKIEKIARCKVLGPWPWGQGHLLGPEGAPASSDLLMLSSLNGESRLYNPPRMRFGRGQNRM